jgi:hypothetical protein
MTIHSLNTVGHLRYNRDDFVDMSVPHTSGHGYAGAEGYDVHLPRHMTHGRCPAAE